jgi:N-acetylmuramoyl-L-alanine amidase
MLLLDLADACRKSGLPVVEQTGWRTRGHGPMSGVRTILAHHTAGPGTGELPSLGTVRDGRPGLEGPLSQLMLARSGTVHVIAAGECWHAGNVAVPTTQSNPWSLGIEAEHDGVSPWPAAQYAAYVRLCAALCAHYRLGADRVMGHKEVAVPAGRKSDPNFQDGVR